MQPYLMDKLPSEMGSFTLKEATFLTHISRSKLAHFCHAGIIKGNKVGKGRWRIPRQALLAFMYEYNIPLDLARQGKCPQIESYPPIDFKRCE